MSAAPSAPRVEPAPAEDARAWGVLAVLCFVYALNFLDRQLLSILAKPIQDSLHVTDGQLGLIGGLYFAFFYCFIAVPVGWFADRTNRVTVLSLACAIWSAATMACGFASSYPQLVVARMTVGFGEAGGVPPSYALITDGLRIKPYPCGGLTHQVIDSVLEFRAKHGLTAEMIDRVDVDVVKHTFDRIVFRVPQTGIQGKFCMPYLVARAIIDGKIGLHIFTDSAVRDQNVLKLAERVQMNLDSNLKKSDAAGRPCRVTVRLKNGQTFTREAQHAKGGPEHPMSEAELRDKFTECAREVLDARSAAQASDYIDNLETLSDIRTLCGILRG